jgi:hypothetical protein
VRTHQRFCTSTSTAKAKKMSHLDLSATIPREAWTIYRSTYFRAWLQLSGTSFSRKELAKIESSPIRTLQSAMGQPNMPLEVVFGPTPLRHRSRHLQCTRLPEDLSTAAAHPQNSRLE